MIRRPRALLALLTAAVAFGCGDGPVEPAAPTLELVVAGGDGQYGTPFQRLTAPLQVLVRRADTHAPQEGVAVAWRIESGDAGLATAAVSSSDGQGLAVAAVQLGGTPGEVTVRAEIQDQAGALATFTAYVVDHPMLSSVTPAEATGGDTIALQGTGFSADAGQNVVLFSGIRGRVTSATSTELRVEVPSCLPARTVSVTAQLGLLVSDGMDLTVSDGGTTLQVTPGVPLDVDDAAGYTCLRVPGDRRYLVTVQSTGTVGAARYGFRLTGLASTGVVAASPNAAPRMLREGSPEGFVEGFETSLRLREDGLVRSKVGRSRVGVAPARAAAAVPSVGDRRAFKVLNAEGTLDDISAVVRAVSRQAVLYVDDTAPGGGFTDQELRDFASTFDDVIHPTITGSFGAPSDLDANERVAILFTPAVNRLTPRGSDGFIGGFFYGLDLLDRDGSNRGEIFYALVPDSAGTFSDPRSRSQVLQATPAVLAHEFQHMVHFNERVLKLDADGNESLWLSEGLAQMAEELVARAFFDAGQVNVVEDYRSGNRVRARRYLTTPADVSLIVASGRGTLAERGAAWLYTLYLWDRWGGDDVLARLTQTTLTGTANVTAATGAAWGEVFMDWGEALYVDGQAGQPYAEEYPDVDLRDLIHTGSPYPLVPESLGGGDFTRSGQLWSSSVQHYILVPPTSGFVALRLGGEAGAGAPAEAALRLRVLPLY